MCNKKVAIVIPLHNQVPNLYEQVSIQQCLKVLGKHPIIFISRPHLDTSFYKNQYSNNGDVSFMTFQYAEGVMGFDRLLLSSYFYEAFLDYEYILLYHTDAFVFRDELEQWCNRNFDYLGASFYSSWFINMFMEHSRYRYLLKLGLFKNKNNGNGGFSLRKVRSHYINSKLFSFLAKEINEDVFWSFRVPYLNPFFKVPSLEKARNFAYEDSPQQLFELHNKVLPFGCHAWHKNDIEFWRPHLKAQGFDV